MLKIQQGIKDQIIAHAKKDSPIEACGYLAGKDGVVMKAYELSNIDKSPEHFSFDPKEQFDTVRDTRNSGLEVYAVYHSHPASPARPSEEDIRLAYDPNISYVIVSLMNGSVDLNSYKIKDSKVTKEDVEVIHG